jgi:hypothetical protein
MAYDYRNSIVKLPSVHCIVQIGLSVKEYDSEDMLSLETS